MWVLHPEGRANHWGYGPPFDVFGNPLNQGVQYCQVIRTQTGTRKRPVCGGRFGQTSTPEKHVQRRESGTFYVRLAPMCSDV